ncbi:MAG TPA: zf-HC2 domain-containing protein [Gaiellaceae bacterium]|nr:zf-HC2 domain-containing protein [Gaiellaceae bacterium]
MPSRISADECARATEWVSLRLDRQLSDFEEVLLEAHLARCPECKTFAARMIGATEALRATAHEQPAVRFEAPRRTGGRTGALRAVSAAAAIAVVGLSGLVGLQLSASHSRPGTTVDLRTIGLKERQMDELSGPARAGTEVRPSLAEQVTVGAAPAVVAPAAIPRGIPR